MKKQLFILFISVMFFACDKDNDDKNYTYDELYPFGQDAPFFVPIVNWDVDYDYILKHLPEDFTPATSSSEVGGKWLRLYRTEPSVIEGRENVYEINYSFSSNKLNQVEVKQKMFGIVNFWMRSIGYIDNKYGNGLTFTGGNVINWHTEKFNLYVSIPEWENYLDMRFEKPREN